MIVFDPMLPAIMTPVLIPMPMSSCGRPSFSQRALAWP
jgi:hypothetical protein